MTVNVAMTVNAPMSLILGMRPRPITNPVFRSRKVLQPCKNGAMRVWAGRGTDLITVNDALSKDANNGCKVADGRSLCVDAEQTVARTAGDKPIISVVALSTTCVLVHAVDKKHNLVILPAADGEVEVQDSEIQVYSVMISTGRRHKIRITGEILEI